MQVRYCPATVIARHPGVSQTPGRNLNASREGATFGILGAPGIFLNQEPPGAPFALFIGEIQLPATQKISRAAFLTAVCVALGYIFLAVPNVEMITAGIFISGIWMGSSTGIAVGLLAESIYSLLNPMGFPPPPLFAAQLIAMGTVGWAGGTFRKLLGNDGFFSPSGWVLHLYLAIYGIVLTFWYDLLTNLSFPLAAGFDLQQIKWMLLMGVPFAALHIGVNAAVFALIIPVFLKRFPNWRSA